MSVADVNQLKESLLKQLPAESDEAIARARDILARLDETHVTLALLADTLVGKAVTQFKSHETLGPVAKKLVKKWKQVAKGGTAPAKPAAAAAVVKVERRTSLSDEAGPEDFEAEMLGLPPLRQNICRKFLDILQSAKEDLVKLGINADAIGHLVGPRAIEVEAAVWNKNEEKKAYSERCRSLAFNMKKNKGLTQDVILGQIDAETLASMSNDELLSDEMRQKRAEEAKKLIESKRLDWDKANESKINEMCGIKGDLLKASLFTCGRCKSTKTTSTQKQTRSADEPMTGEWDVNLSLCRIFRVYW